jgi:hypothetical protein
MTTQGLDLSRMEYPTPVTLSPADARRQRLRSIAIALALGFMAILFYAATIVRMGAQVVPGAPM